MEIKQIIKTIAKNNNIEKSLVELIVKEWWKTVRDTIQGTDFNEDISDKYVNFSIKGLGKLVVESKRKEKIDGRIKNKKSKTTNK